MYLGIDIGSSSSKAVVLSENGEIRGESVRNIGTGSKGPRLVVDEALSAAGVEREKIGRAHV